MKRIVYAALWMFPLVSMPMNNAGAVEQDYEAPAEETILIKEESGFSYELAGDAEEEGALKLFVMNAASDYEIYDINADDLNRIAPAAGIKLQFEF